MIKLISVMKRHPGLTMEEFISRYETHHAAFGERLFAKARRYVRRYVQPETNPITGAAAELDFDVVMEIWWKSREDLDDAMQAVAQSPLLDEIRRSGEKLFASHSNPAFTVLEYDSELEASWLED